MSLRDALVLASLVDAAHAAFLTGGEAALVTYFEAARVELSRGGSVEDVRARLVLPTTAATEAVAQAWLDAANTLITAAHEQLDVPGANPLTFEEALAFAEPGILALRQAALTSARTAAGDTGALLGTWDRQYERGGAWTQLRGTMRGASAGTLNTLAGASLIDGAARSPDWILGAYNPLDERTGELDRALVLNRGDPIVTARGRTVRSIPGRTGKYTLANAWVPGSPAQGGDTHPGCRCVLIPERA